MTARPQITRDIHIGAAPPHVWAILADTHALPKWAPLVHEIEACSSTGEEVGATRTCRVSMGSREGHMVERVVAIDPGVSVTYTVDDESFGMNRMFDGYGFRVSVTPDGDGTRARIETYYTPRNPVVFAMNALFMRRQMRRLVDQLLGGLRAHAESLNRVAVRADA